MKALLNFLFGLRGAFLAAGRDLMGNKAARTVMIGGVIFYSLLYPLPFHNEVPQKLPLFVVDQARSDLSRQLMRMIDSTEGVRVAAVTDSPQLALERMKGGDATAVLIIPGDFSRNIMRSGKTILPLYCDANYLLSYRVAFTGVRLAAENLGAGVRVERYQKAGMPQLSALSLQVRGQASVFTLYNPAGNYFLNTVPAVFVVILQQIMIIGCAMMSGKAWSSPTPGEHGRDACATTGRILLCCCLFFLHALYYFWLLPIFYDVPRPHSFGLLLLFLFPLFWAAASLGCFFGRLLKTPEMVFVAILPCALPMLFLSGAVWPPEAMPAPARFAAQFMPTTPGIVGYRLIMGRGAGFAEIMPLWLQLWGLALAYYGLAIFPARQKKPEHQGRAELLPADSAPSDA